MFHHYHVSSLHTSPHVHQFNLPSTHTDNMLSNQACVVPRPIGWISTRSTSGTDNLAPYSQFTNLTFDPPYVMFSSNRTPEGKRKDTVVNAEETGMFSAGSLPTLSSKIKVMQSLTEVLLQNRFLRLELGYLCTSRATQHHSSTA